MMTLSLRPAVRALSIAWLLALPATTIAGSPSPAPLRPGWAVEFLSSRLGLDDRELARVGRGEALVRMIRKPGDREIAVLGVIPLPAAPRDLHADFTGIEQLRGSNPDLIGMGRLSTPATAAELAAIELERRTLPQLAKCQPRQCAVNVPAEAVEPLRTDADPDARFREALLRLAIGYQAAGDASLPVLAGRPMPVPIADAPAPLLSRTPSLAQIAPSLEAHFRSWTGADRHAHDGKDIFYWLREKSWKHEVVSLVHAAFDEERFDTGRVSVLAEKTYYANHYFRSALAITGVLEDASGSYLFYVNRSETDNGTGFNFIERALAGYLIPRRLSKQIVALRDSLAATRAARD
jgi:hypothetical protein